MADAKITDLTEQLDIQNDDLLVIVDDSALPKTTKKIKASTLLDKAFLGIGQVDNTSDINKPVSAAQQTALDLKYDSSNPSGYETPLELDARDTADRDRVNHTGTQVAATISDFDAEVSNNPAVALNNSKVSNATHSGEVIGDAALALDKSAINNKTLVVPAAGDMLLVADASDLDNLKKIDVANFVPPIFGTYFQSIEAELEVSTFSELYLPINELVLTTPILPLGNYYVGWSMELGDGAAEFIIKDNLIVLGESDNLLIPRYRFREVKSNFKVLTAISGVHTISMNYRTETGGAQATFARRRRLVFYRVA